MFIWRTDPYNYKLRVRLQLHPIAIMLYSFCVVLDCKRCLCTLPCAFYINQRILGGADPTPLMLL